MIFVFSGFGNGLEDGGWNAWIGNMENPNQLLGFLHGSYGLGATISPLLATALVTKANQPWYTFYYIMVSLPVSQDHIFGWIPPAGETCRISESKIFTLAVTHTYASPGRPRSPRIHRLHPLLPQRNRRIIPPSQPPNQQQRRPLTHARIPQNARHLDLLNLSPPLRRRRSLPRRLARHLHAPRAQRRSLRVRHGRHRLLAWSDLRPSNPRVRYRSHR